MLRLMLLAMMIVPVSWSQAADWNRFRGPNGSGVAAQSEIPTEWSESRNIAWKVDLPGPGASSPVTWKGNIYLTCYSGADEGLDSLKRHLLCFDLKTGQKQWETVEAAELPEDEYRGFITEHGYATNTPVVDDSGIYVFYGKSGVLAYDLSGNKRWQTSVGKESSSRRWGSSSSPVLFENLVIVVASDESESLRALDKTTGEIVWQKEASGFDLTFDTPILIEHEGKTELVIAVPNEVWSFDPATGALNWYCEAGFDGNVSPSLVTDGTNVYGMGGRQGSGAAVKVGGKGDVTESHLLWKNRYSSYVPSAVLLEGYLYWADDSGVAHCVNATDGDLIYRERLPTAGARRGASRPYYASVVATEKVIVATSRTNGFVVYEAGPEFKILSENRIEGDDTDFNATPTIAGNALLLRSNKALYCVRK